VRSVIEVPSYFYIGVSRTNFMAFHRQMGFLSLRSKILNRIQTRVLCEADGHPGRIKKEFSSFHCLNLDDLPQ
jgi:hypothetical protein